MNLLARLAARGVTVTADLGRMLRVHGPASSEDLAQLAELKPQVLACLSQSGTRGQP